MKSNHGNPGTFTAAPTPAKPSRVPGRIYAAVGLKPSDTYSMQVADAAPDAKRWPNLVRYIEQQHARPSIAPLIT